MCPKTPKFSVCILSAVASATSAEANKKTSDTKTSNLDQNDKPKPPQPPTLPPVSNSRPGTQSHPPSYSHAHLHSRSHSNSHSHPRSRSHSKSHLKSHSSPRQLSDHQRHKPNSKLSCCLHRNFCNSSMASSSCRTCISGVEVCKRHCEEKYRCSGRRRSTHVSIHQHIRPRPRVQEKLRCTICRSYFKVVSGSKVYVKHKERIVCERCECKDDTNLRLRRLCRDVMKEKRDGPKCYRPKRYVERHEANGWCSDSVDRFVRWDSC